MHLLHIEAFWTEIFFQGQGTMRFLAKFQENSEYAWRVKLHPFHIYCKPATTSELLLEHKLCSHILYLMHSICCVPSSPQCLHNASRSASCTATTIHSNGGSSQIAMFLYWHIFIAIFSHFVTDSGEDYSIFRFLVMAPANIYLEEQL